ncbi:uncharacterized protein LOC134819740 [Bolinopsis microptera]|uniref:uncharacterized protein LOC134819740 n=1 Tax=Bolinopsis microptera TaxID=2820187 RepID=UPI0030797C97
MSSLPNLLALLIVLWHSQLSHSVEICCCPDLTLSLTAEVSDTTKSLENGFMYIAKQDSTVSLRCDLGDKDHPAIKSVVYKFHKTYDLSTSKPISLDSKNKELCSDDDVPTCDLTNVQYTDRPSMQNTFDTADNHIYQCYAEITMIDDAVVKLWSHTVKLDVYYPPIKENLPVVSDPKSVSIGKAMEKLLCKLPESNPKTKARWSFEKKDTSTWVVIDIPNDQVRGDRLVIAEDDISAISKDDIDRGTLLIMIFNEDEDQGNYKCEAVYDTEFDDTDMTYELSKYEVTSNGQNDAGALLLRPVSEITEPNLVDQDSTHVNFTVYIRDTPGRGKWGDVSYIWQIEENNQDVDLDFDKHPNLQLSNHGRTLTVRDLVKYREHEFQCKIKRTTDGVEADVTSKQFGVGKVKVVIAPKYLSIPLTSRTCVNLGDDLKAAPNKAYMMPSEALAGDNAKQILLKADNWKFYLNDYKIQFITDTDQNFDYEDRAGIDQAQYELKLPDPQENHQTRCIYWQYMRAYGLQYQLFEVMKTERFKNKNKNLQANQFEFQQICEKATIVIVYVKEDEDIKVSLTFSADMPITSAHCLKADLVDSTNKILDSKRLRVSAADSCATWTLPQIFEFTGIAEQLLKGLKIKISTDSCVDNNPSYSCTIEVDAKKCSKPTDIPNSDHIENISPDVVNAGESFTVKCAPGYILKTEMICQRDGTVSDSKCVLAENDIEEVTDQDEDKKRSPMLIIILVVAGVVVLVVVVVACLIKRQGMECANSGKSKKKAKETNKTEVQKDGVKEGTVLSNEINDNKV